MKRGVISRRVFGTLRISALVSLIEMDGWIDGFFLMDFDGCVGIWVDGLIDGWMVG